MVETKAPQMSLSVIEVKPGRQTTKSIPKLLPIWVVKATCQLMERDHPWLAPKLRLRRLIQTNGSTTTTQTLQMTMKMLLVSSPKSL